MARAPHNAPLGATPMLPPPTESVASRKVAALFEKAAKAEAKRIDTSVFENENQNERENQAHESSSGRSYSLAKAFLGNTAHEVVLESEPEIPSAWPDDDLEPPRDGDHEGEAIRPPHGAPTIRPSVRKAASEPISQDVLEQAASSVFVSTGDAKTFDIVIRDDVFSDLMCRIAVEPGGVVATFRAGDDNTRRLLEAEAGRLRVRLEERGLRVIAVKVE